MKVRLFEEERRVLKAIAKQHGYQYAGEGSVTLLLRAIANGSILVNVNDLDLPEGGDFTGIRLSPNDKAKLDRTILDLKLRYGDKPSYSLFLKAIANSQATLKKIFSDPP